MDAAFPQSVYRQRNGICVIKRKNSYHLKCKSYIKLMHTLDRYVKAHRGFNDPIAYTKNLNKFLLLFQQNLKSIL